MNREHYTPPRHHRICKRAQARNNHLTALADYITALAIGLALTALGLAYFDIL